MPPDAAPALHVKHLALAQMYGVAQHGLAAEDLATGINIIYGPNAAGKTTLARGLEALLWPESPRLAPHRPSGHGQFAAGAHTYRVELDAGRARYQRDGVDRDRPDLLPPAHTRHRYHLYLHELLQAIDRPDAFADAIHRQAAGGYDLSAAATSLGFEEASGRVVKETTEALQQRKRLQEVQRKQQALQQKQSELTGMKAALAEAQAARCEAAVLRRALSYREAQTEARGAAQQVAGFPEAMARLRPDDLETIDTLDNEIAQHTQAIEEAEATRAAAEADLQDNPLPVGGLPAPLLPTLKGHVEALKDAEQTIQRLTVALNGRIEEAAAAWDAIYAEAGQAVEDAPRPDSAASIDAAALRSLTTTARKAAETLAAREAARKQLEWLEPAVDASALEPHAAGVRQLRHWLRAATDDGPGSRSLVGIAIAGFLLVAALGAFIGWQGEPLGWAVAGLGTAAALGGLLYEQVRPQGAPPARTYQHDFERLPLDAPAAWEPAAVEAHLRGLEGTLTELRLAAAQATERARLAEELEGLEADVRRMEHEQQQVAEALGFFPDDPIEMLAGVVEQVSRWQDAQRHVDRLRGEQQAAEATVASLKETIAALVAPYHAEAITSAPVAQAVYATLKAAAADLTEAQEARASAEQAAIQAEKARATKQQRQREVYRRLGLDVGDQPAVEAMLAQYAAFAEAQEKASKAETIAEDRHATLAAHDHFSEALLQADRTTLDARLAKAEGLAETAKEKQRAITALEQRIAWAQEGQDLAEAHAAYRECQAALAARYRADAQATAGAILAEHLAAATQDQQLPAVFKQARALLLQFTRGRYRLTFDQAAQAFGAIDTQTGAGHPLGSLSSGTRVQLLLAVRVAFVEHQEDGWRLPLILDEALANSDDARADALIATVITLAARGRQVFYLTAQRDEVARWRGHLQQTPGVSHAVVKLSATREAPLPETPAPAPVPGPDLPDPSCAHAAYGEALKPPAWSPRSPVGGLHLWYMQDDVAALHASLAAGVARWGPFEAMADAGLHEVLGHTPEAVASLKARAAAIQAWRKAWRVGRGRRVTSAALEDSGAVSETFRKRVAALNDELDGDAEALLKALRAGAVKRFHMQKVDALEAYLQAEGYLDPSPRLAPAEIRARVLMAVAAPLKEGVVTREAIDRVLRRLAP
jgi:energy-coupling factor transporter ATP-binding protein EcfA2